MRVVVGLAIALACPHAHADAALAEPPASYRPETLAADGVALGLVAAGVATDADALVLLGAGAYVICAPIAHLSRQRTGRAGASFAMRLGLPVFGALIGASLPRDCGGDCIEFPPKAFLFGLGAGIVAATSLDAIFLAKGDASQQPAQAAWTPVVTPTRAGVALGVAGSF